MEKEKIQADVLCLGGGPAALMAAIRASEKGAKVVVVEKANTKRSGKAGVGVDHFYCYMPEVHGNDIDAFYQEVARPNHGGDRFLGMDKQFMHNYLRQTGEIVKMWEEWGVPMKYKDKYEFGGHGLPAGLGFTALSTPWLHFGGQTLKKVLTEQALKRGVRIVNRVMATDLLMEDGRLVGAIGIGTRENKMFIFQAKSVFLGTGDCCYRLYPTNTEIWFGNRPGNASHTGDGRMMAYRAGCELGNLEMPRFQWGPKYFARYGQASFIGIYRDGEGRPIAPWCEEMNREVTGMREFGRIPPKLERWGRGPVYIDGKGMTDEDYEYMMHWFTHESLGTMIEHMKEEGIDQRKNQVEFMAYNFGNAGAIRANKKCETSVKGIFAAGDEAAVLLPGSVGISGASTYGWFAGENAAAYAEETEYGDMGAVKSQIEEREKIIEDIQGREAVGPDWIEANIAIQQTMRDYAGNTRSEPVLKQGLHNLLRLKRKIHATMISRNQHELGRCLEVLNLLDLGELVFTACRARKESRGDIIRSDYPLSDPRLDRKLCIIKDKDGKPDIEWKEPGI